MRDDANLISPGVAISTSCSHIDLQVGGETALAEQLEATASAQRADSNELFGSRRVA